MVSSSGCGRKTGRRFFHDDAGRVASASQSRCCAPVQTAAGADPRSEALPRQKRLAKRREFLRVYETGRKLFSRYTVVFVAGNDFAYSRIGITATKKLGKATVRNRLKRWTREVFRRQREPLALDEHRLDIVVNVKPNAAAATFSDYREDLSRLLGRLGGEPRR